MSKLTAKRLAALRLVQEGRIRWSQGMSGNTWWSWKMYVPDRIPTAALNWLRKEKYIRVEHTNSYFYGLAVPTAAGWDALKEAP